MLSDPNAQRRPSLRILLVVWIAACCMSNLRCLGSNGPNSETETEEAGQHAQRRQERQLAESTIQDFSCYRDIQGVYDYMLDLSTTHPTLVTLVTIGESYLKSVGQGGFNIQSLKITAPGKNNNGTRARLFALAGLHAREYSPPELLLRFASHLVSNYNVDADITMILQNTEIHLVPLANPDGRKYGENNQEAYQRKNMHYDATTSCDAGYSGVDLNRNFPFMWGLDTGSVSDPCGEDFRGYAPASEPEVKAIVNYVSNLFPSDQRKTDPTDVPYPAHNTGLFFDIHSWGDASFWPWAFVEKKSRNDLQLRTLAMKFESFNGYIPTGAGGVNWWYPSSGGAEDWAYGELGVASVLFEVGTAFYEDCDYFEGTILGKMIPALIYGAKVARQPYKTPLGPDIMKVARPMKTPTDVPSVPQGSVFILRVCASDGARISNRDENYVETGQQAVIGVDVYIDVYPENQDSAAWHMSMMAADGSFDSISEVAELQLDLASIALGRHTVYFQAIDSQGFQGAITARFFDVCDPLSQGCSAEDIGNINAGC
jgi:carboxypeptidase T